MAASKSIVCGCECTLAKTLPSCPIVLSVLGVPNLTSGTTARWDTGGCETNAKLAARSTHGTAPDVPDSSRIRYSAGYWVIARPQVSECFGCQQVKECLFVSCMDFIN